jgi:hypothetical protein
VAAADHRGQWRRAGPGLGLAVERPVVGPTGRSPSRPPLVLTVAVELTTVGDDVAIVHDGVEVRRYDELEPDTTYVLDGVGVRTLERPPGDLLCRFATVNDVHFGETDCGRLDESQPELGPILTVDDGQPPHPQLMGRAAVPEIAAIEPAAVVVKGDLTAWGTRDEYAAFLACYGQAFDGRLHHVRGNHDAMAGETYADGPQRIDLPGVTVALLDTVVPGSDSGTVDADQLAWLDDLSATAHVPVVVMAHHYPWSPDSTTAPDSYFGIHPEASRALVELIARRTSIVGCFAGHSHRNRVRQFSATGPVPYVEVACAKDYPGSWAEYRVYEGGILQLHHRISAPDALAWSERCRGLYADFGVDYAPLALGAITDRCFAFGAR